MKRKADTTCGILADMQREIRAEEIKNPTEQRNKGGNKDEAGKNS